MLYLFLRFAYIVLYNYPSKDKEILFLLFNTRFIFYNSKKNSLLLADFYSSSVYYIHIG